METRLCAIGLAIAFNISLPANAASPTPNLKTGDYQGLRALIVVGEPTQYGGDGVAANTHPTTVRYDAATQTYILHDYDGDAGFRFSPGEIVASQTSTAYTTYRDTATGSTLRLLNQSSSNPVIALTYVTYGKWNIPKASGETYKFADNYVVFGQKTPSASVPRSGTAAYGAILDGSYQRGAASYRLSGTARYTANFGSGTMGVTVTPVATPIAGGTALQFGTLTGSGYIYASGSPSNPNATFSAITPYVGTTRYASYGSFYGPQANEIGGVFTIKSKVGGSLGEGGGAFVGRKN